MTDHVHKPTVCACGVPVEVDGWEPPGEQTWKPSGKRTHLNLRSEAHLEALADAMPGHAADTETPVGHEHCRTAARATARRLLAQS